MTTEKNDRTNIEQVLMNAPHRSFESSALDRIDAAIDAADAPVSRRIERHRGPGRRIALWQAVAASVIVGSVCWVLGSRHSSAGPDAVTAVQSPIRVEVVQDVFSTNTRARRPMDIRRWNSTYPERTP